jgi:hypothetical protein
MYNKNTPHSSLCNGLRKDHGSFRDPTQCNFVGQIKGGSSEASRCQSNNIMYCSPVTSYQKQSIPLKNVSNITNVDHPEDLYVEEDCNEVAGDWEEEYKLLCEAGN